MTTLLTAADGTTLEVDEETECVGHTHINDSPVVSTQWTGPTPPRPAKVIDPNVRRAELLAELDALGGFTPLGTVAGAPVTPAAPPVDEAAALKAQIAAIERQRELAALRAQLAELQQPAPTFGKVTAQADTSALTDAPRAEA